MRPRSTSLVIAAVLALATTCRCCKACATAAASFAAVARGAPATGATQMLVLSRSARIGAPGFGASSANGCGSGWPQAAAVRRNGGTAAGRIRHSVMPRNIPLFLVRDRDRRQGAAVTALAAQTGAAIAEEAFFLGQRVVRRPLDHCDAGAHEAMGDIAGKIEQKMAGTRRRREEDGAGRIFGEKRRREFGPDLVREAADAWADAGADVAAPGAELRHPRDRRLDDAAEGAAPAGMGGADDPRPWVAQQHRRAISGQDAESEAGSAGDEPVRRGRLLGPPRARDDDRVGAVPLPHADQPIAGKPQPGRRNVAIARHPFRPIARAEAAIQRGERAFADAALARKEGVPDAGIRGERRQDDHGAPSPSAKPGGTGKPGEVSASTL